MVSLSHKDMQVIDFLITREPNKDLVERIVGMLADREFYYPEIKSQAFRNYQLDLNDLINEVRFQKSLTAQLIKDRLRRDYDDKLIELVGLKRRLLVFGIMMQEEDKRRELLLKLIYENRLQNRILLLKEVIRK